MNFSVFLSVPLCLCGRIPLARPGPLGIVAGMSDSSHAGLSANRRQFLSHVGHGVAAAAVGGILATPACSEGQEAAPAAAPAPAGGKKLGYALVGLGKLTTNELLPALQQTQHSRCVALVSGSAEKAKKPAEKFNVNPKAVYN